MLKQNPPIPTEAELALSSMKQDAQRIIDNVARMHSKLCKLDQSRIQTGVMHLETAMMWIEKGAQKK